VRLAVAKTLAQAAQKDRLVAAQTVVTAQNLARDASAEVQQQAIDSLSGWPLEKAGPVLLLAIAEGGYRGRKTAAAQLSARWPAAADFPVDAAAERRTAAIADLKRLWGEKYGATNDLAAAAHAEAQQLLTLSDDRVQELQRLPSRDATERRAAAAEMAVETATALLSPLALNRLAELVKDEKDPLVWRSILTAIAGDPRDAAAGIAYEAIGNASVEVRRGACEYLAAHGDPRHGQILLGVLQDPDRTVVLAAVRALGAVRILDDPEPLVRMLLSPDRHLQLEAALSLSRLHAPQGAEVLERLASDADLEVRLRAAKAMGEVADQTFLPVLVTLLTDQPVVQQAALTSMEQIACKDVVAPEDGSALSNEEKVRRWQLWYRKRQDRDPETRRARSSPL
jgi:HEAT repeat protein